MVAIPNPRMIFSPQVDLVLFDFVVGILHFALLIPVVPAAGLLGEIWLGMALHHVMDGFSSCIRFCSSWLSWCAGGCASFYAFVGELNIDAVFL